MTLDKANQRLASDLKLVMRDAGDLIEATAGAAGDKVNQIRSRLTASLETARVSCDRLQDTAGRATEATDRVIREHTYESMGIALGVGLLVGVLVGNRCSR
ncbi:MAG TPA: DUF883 family protein [Verrucomicrobiae bacterium]|nr:DUF883 family protein [Verrucomicrobiae bacterium]